MTTQYQTQHCPNSTEKEARIAPPLSVPTIAASEISQERFQVDFYQPGIPVVIQGLLSDLDWHLEYLITQLGDREFPIRCYGRDRYQQDKRDWTSAASGVATQMMTFRDYAAWLRNGRAAAEDWYLAKCPLSDTPLAQVSVLERAQSRLGLRLPASGWNLWVGMNHLEQVHYDPSDGTIGQLHGQKRVVCFPPSQLYNLYPFSLVKHLRHGLNVRTGQSYVYVENPDFANYPNFQQALQHRYEVLLHPGDLLFLPVGWWHEVTTVGEAPVCSINRFWFPPLKRAWRSWSMWRVHLGSVLAMPHVAGEFCQAMVSDDRSHKLRQLLQKL